MVKEQQICANAIAFYISPVQRSTVLLSINKCFLYHKKFVWMQDGTSELDTK